MSIYKKPTVILLQHTNVNNSEVAGRLCYNSFNRADSEEMQQYKKTLIVPTIEQNNGAIFVNNIVNKKFHGSIAEHIVMTFHISDIPRGVLQELVRHRIASYSVKSTRYTMSILLIIALICVKENVAYPSELISYIRTEILCTYKRTDIEIEYMLKRLKAIFNNENIDYRDIMSQGQLEYLFNNKYKIINKLSNGKAKEVMNKFKELPQKRNVGDKFKEIVTDNWSTELIMTINLRSFLNFYKLRNNGAAWKPIQVLAQEMFKTLPNEIKYIITKGKIDETTDSN